MGISWYPRPGHRIAPLALREILDAPLPDHLLGRSCPAHMHRLSDLDETAWSHFGPEVCRRLGEVVVREVQRQLNSAPRSLKTRMLPRWLDGVVLEELELEPGTYEALKREQGWLAFAKRIGQVAALRWIGARALVDFLTSLEATVGPTLDEQPQPVQTASPALDDHFQPAQAARVAKGPQTITFHITTNNLNEGGRQRIREAYLNIDRAKATFFGVRDITVVTEDGLEFPAKLSGNSGRRGSPTPKNLRSRPARMLGEWLIERHQARPGDQVHVARLENDRFLFRFVHNPIGAPTQPPLNARIARELAGILTRWPAVLLRRQRYMAQELAAILTHWSVVVLLDGEIRPLRNIPGAETINEFDPRLGHLLQQVGLGAATVQELAARVAERSHALPGPEVAVRLRRLREAVQAKQSMTLDEELRDLVVSLVGHSERNRLIVTRYLGWDGQGGATLQAVGDKFGMSRERVRQICDIVKTLTATKPFAPVLDRVLSVVAERIPAPASAIENSLVAEGLTAASFSLEGLTRAAEVLGRQLPFVVIGTPGGRIALPPQMKAVANEIVQYARKSVEHWGVTTVEDITAQVTEQLPEPVYSDFVAQVLQDHQDFQWLDEAGGWFWLTSVSRNRLLNRINKVLSVSPRINVAELRAGVSRDRRMKGFVPPQRVLLELCRQADGYLVEGSMVSTASPVAWGDALGGTEQILLLALGEHGPVMQRKELEELCIDLGMNRSTFSVYLGHSPILARYAPGVYGLRGAAVEPGLVESLIAPRRRGRVLKDYGWTADGRVWLGFQLSEAMISSGVFTVPAAMKSFVSGEFLLKAEDGSPIGTVVVQESGAWGLGPFFTRRGGEPGDHLILVFDLAAHEAIAHIGDADLLDQFQALDEEGA